MGKLINEITNTLRAISEAPCPLSKMMIESRELNPLLIAYAKLALNIKLED
mgnify:CR=1 FL=1